MDMKERLQRIEPFLEAGDFAAVAAILSPSAPVDIGELFALLDEEYIAPILGYFPEDTAGEVLAHLDPELLPGILDDLGKEKAADVLDTMFLDDVTDLLDELESDEQAKILDLLEDEDAEDIKDLLAYPDDSAGSIMTTEFVAINKNLTAEQAIEVLRREAPSAETVYYVYVVDDDGVLVGVLSLRDLIVTPPDWKIENFMYTRIKSVSDYMDQEEVATLVSRYDIMAVPVIDSEQKLVGIITVDDVIDVIEEERTEDALRMGGVYSDEDDEDLLTSRLGAAVRSRLPWLILTLFGGILAGLVMRGIETQLQTIVALAYFIPLLCGMGGNAGTQCSTVTVRALATGQINERHPIVTVFKEMSVGLVVGAVCAVIIAAVAFFWQHSLLLGVIIGASLLCNMVMAALVGSSVPLVLKRLRIDPAVASAPFISTAIDVIGLLIYATIASIFIPMLGA